MSADLPFSYQIRRSARVAKARIVVKPGFVEVVAPLQFPEQRLHQFVHAKRHWITRSLDKMAVSISEHNDFVPTTFVNGTHISYLGEPVPISLVPSSLKRIKIDLDGGLRIHLPEDMAAHEQQDKIRETLIRWMKRQTKILVQQMVHDHAGRHRLYPRSITIKTQKSRWGSCGIHNDININWLLLLAPKNVLEYVVVHELCHIKVKNHSRQFWDLVGDHLPDYAQRRGWLKKQGRSLMMALATKDAENE